MATIRELTGDDYPAAVAFWQREGRSLPADEASWRRQWEAHPALAAASETWPWGWVIETEAGELEGYLENLPSLYSLGGRPVLAASASSWLVGASQRTLSLSLFARFFKQAAPELLLNASATPVSGTASLGFGCKRLPLESYGQVLFRILDRPRLLRAALIRKQVPPAVARPAAVVGSPVLWAVDAWRGQLGIAEPRADLRTTPVTGFDDEFDRFWSRLGQEHPDRLLLVRNRQHLERYFQELLRRDRAWIVRCERGGAMCGYAVFVRKDNRELGLARAWLADIQVCGDEPEAVLLSLLGGGIRECQARRLHILEAMGFADEKRQVLRRLLGRQRGLPHWPFYYKAKSAGLAAALANPAAWDPGIVDGGELL